MHVKLLRLLDTAGMLHSWTLAPIGLAIAIIVTLHVLLHKRDIGAATTWIGLVWLSPLIGGILYSLLGINRVRRKAQRLVKRRFGEDRRNAAEKRDWEGHLAPLEAAGSRITGRRMVAGNAFSVLENGDAAYPVMIEAIDAARETVGLSSYILRADASGRGFIDAMSRARRRGVEVRVLVDGIGSGYFLSRAYRALRREGVPAARFMHSALPWRMPFLNLRTHKKILVIDGVRGFTGGMNIGSENVLASDPPHPVRDMHFDVRGPVVGQLVEAFARDWSFSTGEDLDLDVWMAARPADSGEAPEAGDAHARVVTSGPDSDIEKIEFLMLQAAACANESIGIVTPYFLPDERLMTALGLAAMRGVKVDVVVPRRSNHLMVDLAMRAHVDDALKDGVRLWLNAPPFEHSKLMVVDGLWSLIGSANFDMRSLRLNFELNVEIYNAALAAELRRVIDSRKAAQLTHEMLSARTLPKKLFEAAVRLLLPYL